MPKNTPGSGEPGPLRTASSDSTGWYYLYTRIEFLSLIISYPTVLLTIFI